MIEKRVPKDIRSYKMKTFGYICTVRQLLFTVGAGGCVLAVYFLVLRPMGIRDYYVSFFVSMLCALPCLAFGWFEPMGVPLEKWAVFAIRYLLAPSNRIEKRKNMLPEKPQKKTKKKPITKKERMQHPEYRGYQ